MAFVCVAAALTGAATRAASVEAPVPGKLMTFGDWTVGCDNGLACQAVSLVSDSAPDEALSVVVTRDIGATILPAIEMSGFTTKADRYRIVIDGKVAHTGTMQVGAETIKISAADAIKLARAMARGKAMRVIDGGGADLGAASLSGISASLRYIDAQQGRAGSRGAVVAAGPKMAAAKKAAAPVISAKKITPTDMLPDAAALVTLSESSPCAAERFGSTEDTAYSLGTGADGPQALVMLNCGAGAYNFSSGIYTGQRDKAGKWSFAPAKFDYGAAGFAAESKIPILINADWDAAKQTISSYAKGRGLGDCGTSESWVWDGSGFRLTSARAMGECRGSLDWIPIWRAEVRLTP
ncbi:MAG TPA: DUF1176 domain-containing protein [Sphingorhabdus sp.]|jgi:hypothetical protein|nr:DUF1176 domain-containing protein [Sphingorhabdus sp.]